jgi:putative spermidine/putrescine transport system permease protein
MRCDEGCVNGGGLARVLLRGITLVILGFIYIPIALIFVYSFNAASNAAWPPAGFTLDWWAAAAGNTGLRQAFLTSLSVALGATAIALVLGTLAAFAVARYRFFGRETISFIVVFPIALPGIVTGMAFSRTFAETGFTLGWMAIVVSHATFCVVLVYNNAIARLRRTSQSLEEASADLGADTWTTFRYVTFPQLRSALLAGGLLAFALSFDEIIVTIFTAGGVKTLPIWIFQSFRLNNQVPIVNVAGAVAILLSVVPVYVATRLSHGEVTGRV